MSVCRLVLRSVLDKKDCQIRSTSGINGTVRGRAQRLDKQKVIKRIEEPSTRARTAVGEQNLRKLDLHERTFFLHFLTL